MPRPPLPLLAAALLLAAAPWPPAPASAAEPPPGRLSHDVVPTFESVELDLNATKADYAGKVHIDLDVRRAVDRFRLHSEGSRLTSVILTARGHTIAVTPSEVSHGLWELRAAAPLPRGRAALDIAFTNDFDTHGSGLYRLESGGDWYSFTQFEATDAREAFPCFDEPEFKIPWQMTLVVPKASVAITNMPPLSEKSEGDSRRIVYRRTPPMPSYLLAVCTGPFETVDVPGTKIPTRIVVARGQTGLTGHARQVVGPLLAGLERYFGRPYPYDKLDLIAVPEYWYGAMENPGAIVFVDNLLLLPEDAGVGQRRRLASVTCHEMAHMWFGDLVTMKWWDDLWLNESFATWMGNKVVDEVYPDLQTGLNSMDGVDRAKQTDAGGATRAMRKPVDVADNLDQLADALAYNKGHAVLMMFEQWLTPEVFQKGVRLYIRQNAWKNAEAADLWNALSRVSGKDVGGAMATFLNQPGVPLVTVEPGEGAAVTLTQRRFTHAGVETKPGLWKIPVTLRYSDGGPSHTTTVLLDRPSMTVTLPGVTKTAWIFPNAGGVGYYRWLLPPAALDALVANAGAGLDVAERRGMVSDLLALFEGGEVDADRFLAALGRCGADPDPVVIGEVLDVLQTVRQRFWSPDMDRPLAAYVRATLRPAVERFGYERRPGDPESVRNLRPQLLEHMADAGHDVVALAQGEALTDAFFQDEDLVDPSMLDVALRVAAIRGDRGRYDAYRERFETTRLPTERAALLSAMARFGDDAIERDALAYALDGPLRAQELSHFLRTMATDPARRAMLFDWIRDHYDAVVARIPDIQRTRITNLMNGCSQERLDAIETFYAQPGHRPIGIEVALDKLRARFTECMALRARDGAAVKAYLDSHMAAR